MINSTAFDYVNVLTKAADASYQREAIALNSLTEDGGVVTAHLNFYENYHFDHYSLLGGTAQPDVERATD